MHFVARDNSEKSLADRYLKEGITHEDVLATLLSWVGRTNSHDHRLIAAGHRVVHGGSLFTGPVRIDSSVIDELQRLVPLAPLHQPHNLAAIAAISKLHPDLPQVACFDTAFHHTQPEVAAAFALPRSITSQGVRRYGFHGLSYEYIAGVLPDVLGRRGRRSRRGRPSRQRRQPVRDASAPKRGDDHGFYRTRWSDDGNPDAATSIRASFSILIQEKGMTPQAVSDLLYHSSGLLGVSGISDDMRTLLASDDPLAANAVALFVYRFSQELGSLAASLGGLDALVFTAGIGEHAPEIRRRACQQASLARRRAGRCGERRAAPQ